MDAAGQRGVGRGQWTGVVSDARVRCRLCRVLARGGGAGQPRRRLRLVCSAQALKTSKNWESPRGPRDPKKEYKIFDEVAIVTRAGNGGRGEIIEEGKGKEVRNFKYHTGASQKKKIWLKASPPANGQDGGDVVLFCAPELDSLAHLHDRKTYTAKTGGNGNPEDGSQAPKRLKRTAKKAQNLRIGVPPGTVVKRKGSGRFMGELLEPGDELVVSRGGKGGLGVIRPSHTTKISEKKQRKKLQASGVDIVEIEDTNWKMDAFGMPGEELSLQLLLRVVADVGFVGLPNAGKSSLLAHLTRATPEVAAYPFTTLMPNLGVMGRGSDPVLVDLPGLIEGAHVGRGLGRNFLRHLRRTGALLQVVDGSTPDPVVDFCAIREELRMYNPDYCRRPFVVALNKMDLIESKPKRDELAEGILAAATQLKEASKDGVLPEAVIPVSALNGDGVEELRSHIQELVNGSDIEVSKGMDPAQLIELADDVLEEMADADWGTWGQ